MKIGDDVKAIWIASVPRTGSMWAFNVIRDLVRSTGRAVQPEIVPHADEEMEAIGQAGIAASDDAVYVLKVHTRIPVDLPKSCFVVTQRDLHDSLISFMRFTKCDFDVALRWLASSVRLERHYEGFPAERTIMIAYADIISNPHAVISALAQHLSIDVDSKTVAEILERYSKNNVQARIAEREQVLKSKINNKQPIDLRDFVPSKDNTVRAFDTETGFQSGHVSTYQEGDWRRILPPRHQLAVDQLIAAVRAAAPPRRP